MGNKFLNRYPKLCMPKIGDKVRMISIRTNEFNHTYVIWNHGDIGEIIDIKDNLYKIDFNNYGNSKIYWDGKWHAVITDFELISHE